MRSMSRNVAASASAAAFGAEPWPGVGNEGMAPPGLLGVDPVAGPRSSALAVKDADGDRSPNAPGATLSAVLLKLAVAREAASSSPFFRATRSVVYVWTVSSPLLTTNTPAKSLSRALSRYACDPFHASARPSGERRSNTSATNVGAGTVPD